MTSDAKIGLLLGLIFIFVIAFVINGLPHFRKNTNNNELTTNMNNFENNSLGIGTKERKAQEAINWNQLLEETSSRKTGELSDGQQDVRSTTTLHGDVSLAKEPNEGFTENQAQTDQGLSSSNFAVEETDVKKPETAQPPAWPKTYTVADGDSLADIAIKFYGSREGNKSININRIFETNRKILKTASEIFIGQKLTIPAPSSLTSGKENKNSVFSSNMFEKVESVGQSRQGRALTDRKYISTDAQLAKQGKFYTVREGDSLWKIAAEQLGNGNRYTEISKLNSDILSNEDSLIVGMRLKIPAR